MKDVPRIEGVPDPRKSGAVNKESEVDADKFKRIMKVDESDEAKKHQKRQQAESEEEENAELEAKQDARVPQTSFSAFLKDTPPKGSLFDVEGGKKAVLTSSDEGPPPPSPLKVGATYEEEALPVDEEIPLPEEINVPVIETPQAIKPTPIEKPQVETPKRIEKDKAKKTEAPVEKKKPLQKEATTSKEAKPVKKPTTQQPEPKKLKAPPEDHFENLDTSESAPEPQKPLKEEKEKPEEIEVALPFPKEDFRKEVLPTSEKKTEKEEKKVLASPERVQSETGKEREGTLFQGASQEAPPPIGPIQVERSALPAYATLKPEIFELFERMVGLMTIQQSKGVSTTTVTLNMPGSVFNGCQIVLEHYQTAPNSFNLQLQGSPRAVEIFNDNMADLTSAFQGAKLSFDVNIRTPVLLREERPQVRRKERPEEEQKERER